MEQNLPKENDSEFQKYREFVYKMECVKDEDLRTRLDHAISGLTKEGGELLGLIQRVKFYKQEIPRINFLDEMGDSVHFFVELLNIFGVTLEEVCRINMTKLKARHAGEFSYETQLAKDQVKDQTEKKEISKLEESNDS